MMKTHRSSRARMLAGAGAILALGGISLAFGSPGFAQPDSQAQTQTQTQTEADAPTTHRREERIIIRTDHDGHSTTRTEHHGDGAGPHEERRERVIVMTHGGEGDHGHGDGHSMVMRHDGDRHEVVIPDCGGGQSDEVNEGTDNNRTRIVLCTRGGEATPAARADRLAHVRERIAGDDELSAEQKARVLAALDRQIARLRGQ